MNTDNSMVITSFIAPHSHQLASEESNSWQAGGHENLAEQDAGWAGGMARPGERALILPLHVSHCVPPTHSSG